MKHIKSYKSAEDNTPKYNIGDYVLHKLPFYGTYSVDNIELDRREKIIKHLDPRYYLVEVYQLDDLYTLTKNLGCREDDIERLLTPEEIEEFVRQKDAFKYNL